MVWIKVINLKWSLSYVGWLKCKPGFKISDNLVIIHAVTYLFILSYSDHLIFIFTSHISTSFFHFPLFLPSSNWKFPLDLLHFSILQRYGNKAFKIARTFTHICMYRYMYMSILPHEGSVKMALWFVLSERQRLRLRLFVATGAGVYKGLIKTHNDWHLATGQHKTPGSLCCAEIWQWLHGVK